MGPHGREIRVHDSPCCLHPGECIPTKKGGYVICFPGSDKGPYPLRTQETYNESMGKVLRGITDDTQ
ncbi:unnamed protein product [Didymodactylos carnosus]|uniref:Uncharacterized protein n=1 Tax=Didymodactylos carnosus TaxID=1234261 RepID=A0A814III6_9BILA|nr:unnamed protein product [Didymodactylos carnosus]CAF1023202.1 unnamed protein product [Didymodactylos carnosus]CAF3720233.1 unnamed protein product [Didymodactylos carnosus]CAF3794522.1 unnamed protein product [Didymodactylos carnosus]